MKRRIAIKILGKRVHFDSPKEARRTLSMNVPSGFPQQGDNFRTCGSLAEEYENFWEILGGLLGMEL